MSSTTNKPSALSLDALLAAYDRLTGVEVVNDAYIYESATVPQGKMLEIDLTRVSKGEAALVSQSAGYPVRWVIYVHPDDTAHLRHAVHKLLVPTMRPSPRQLAAYLHEMIRRSHA